MFGWRPYSCSETVDYRLEFEAMGLWLCVLDKTF
jgi:hypothetical protein